MKNLVLVLVLILTLISCGFGTTRFVSETTAHITSESTFFVKGVLCMEYDGEIPISIYNFNAFLIVIKCNNIEYTISPFDTLMIKEIP